MNISSYRAFGNARKALIGLLLVGASCVSSQASAALVLFNLTGAATASFTLDQPPTPTTFGPGYFQLSNVVGTFLGANSSAINVFFSDDGHLTIYEGASFVDYLGNMAPLFSGTTELPTFNLGTYVFPTFIQTGGQVLSDGSSTLSITSVDGAVPEPSTWMMMLVGFGFLGGAMRYGRKANAVTQTAKLT